MLDETRIRLEAIHYVRDLRERWVAVPASELQHFTIGGRRVFLKGQQGIFKPAELSDPLSITSTIDSPYTCCWAWALVWAYRAVFEGSRPGWCIAGLLVGLGILFKYTMVVWLPSLALFLLFSPQHRQALRARGWWTLVTLACLSAAPIVAWNWRPTARTTDRREGSSPRYSQLGYGHICEFSSLRHFLTPCAPRSGSQQ